MKCPFCSHIESKVADSRPTDDGLKIRRRRECLKCGKRFTTYEIIETTPIIVIKRDGSRDTFNSNKLLNGLMRACEKRPVSISVLEKIVDEVELTLQNSLEKEIKSTVIGELALSHLKKVDQVAYIRFASVYRNFEDVQSFVEELKNLE
ncbi:MAG: transcriptional regulator NrdR [Oscillospiraceae bacterium]